jgi:diguanylate cyclase (GGDEF)-like protein
MKVIVIERGETERLLVQTALDKASHEMAGAGSSDELVGLIRAGQGRIVIADENSLDCPTPEFMRKVRAPDLPSTYILMLVSGDKDLVDSDDLVKKPFTVHELSARIQIAQRFLTLGDGLWRVRQQVQEMAMYDEQTDFMNERAFLRTALGDLERARRASAPFSVIAIEVNDFARLNSTFGAGTNEQVLGLVAKAIREKSRPYDCIGHWAGAQFVIELPNVIGEDAKKISERIIKGIKATSLVIGARTVTMNARAGVSAVLSINASTEVEPLIQQARQAMQRARDAGSDEVNLIYA